MTPMNKALQVIGMTQADMNRADFYRRSGRKAAKALRDMGLTFKRFPTYAGHGVMRWEVSPGSDCPAPEWPAFHILVAAIARQDVAAVRSRKASV